MTLNVPVQGVYILAVISDMNNLCDFKALHTILNENTAIQFDSYIFDILSSNLRQK